jgi:hypothetical protein
LVCGHIRHACDRANHRHDQDQHNPTQQRVKARWLAWGLRLFCAGRLVNQECQRSLDLVKVVVGCDLLLCHYFASRPVMRRQRSLYAQFMRSLKPLLIAPDGLYPALLRCNPAPPLFK